MANKIKTLGQVFTPSNIVEDMLNLIDYKGEKILKKHIIDNSCGDGAFLKRIVEIYILEYKKKYGSLIGVEKDLEEYIHGIEIDKKFYLKCLENLDNIAFWASIKNVNWNIFNCDTLEYTKFDGMMDYVIGNPPYVRIHNLGENFNKIRDYKFCKKGMADLYIVFYEIGFNMLNKNGILCYITPNSFYSSKAGLDFRNYIISNKSLSLVADLGHYQPFKVSTYTTICKFENNTIHEYFDFYRYSKDGKYIFEEKLKLVEAFNDGKMILAKKREQNMLMDIQNYIPKNIHRIQVKNGFATLADKIFITNEILPNSIRVIKASTGEWNNCIFPYDTNLNIIEFNSLENETKHYLKQNKKLLEDRSLEKNAKWYGFGRSQAIKDVYKNKISINTTIKDISTIKINQVRSGEGVYSGLYILGNVDIKTIEKHVKQDCFITYLKALGKCKNGGYYTFSSKDLEKYLIYKMENADEQ